MRFQSLAPMFQVQDLARTLAFYCETVGFTPKRVLESDGQQFWALLEVGSSRVMFAQAPPGEGPGSSQLNPGDVVLYLFVEDLLGARRELLAHGARPSELTITSLGMAEFRVRDPDGYALWFAQDNHAVELEVPPLSLAASNGDLAEVRKLLGTGFHHVNGVGYFFDWEGPIWTPLHAAVEGGHRDVVEMLLEAGALVDGVAMDAREYWTPAELAVGPFPELTQLLLERGASRSLHLCAALGDEEQIRKKLALQPALLEARGPDGGTLLHFAALGGQTSLVDVLLGLGANPGSRDLVHQRQPWQWARDGSLRRRLRQVAVSGGR